jgi:transcription antitermination factor NusG
MSQVGDRVRVTTAPWAGTLGTIESVDGAYNIVRLDTSEHPDDVQELYPNEFEVV